MQTGPKGIPFLVTHDGRTIRYPDPVIKVNDTIHLDIATAKILDSIRFDSGNKIIHPQSSIAMTKIIIILDGYNNIYLISLH